MPPDSTSTALPAAPVPTFAIRKKRTSFLGLTLDECIRVFFGGNAFVAVIVLALITFFLFKEGSAFFGQNRDSLRTYRQAGLEYVDLIRQQEQDHTALTRYLFDIRMNAVRKLAAKENLAPAEIQARFTEFDAYAERYSDTVLSLRGLVSDLTDVATDIKTRYNENEDYKIAKQQFSAAGMQAEADAIEIKEIDFKTEVLAITGIYPAYEEINREFAAALESVVVELPSLPVSGLEPRLVRFQELTRQYVAGFPAIEAELKAWDPNTPVTMSESFSTFIFGQRWLTASFWQDWYGIIPLFVGSLMVSAIALTDRKSVV